MNWIVPFPPGWFQRHLHRPSRPSSASAWASRRGREPRRRGRHDRRHDAARSKPDGCTLLVVNPSLTFASIVYAESGFDLMRDFAPVSGLAQVPVALVVNPSKIDAKDLAGLSWRWRASLRERSTSARPASARSRISPSCFCSSGQASSSRTCPIAAADRPCRT
jgi:hypothetical protein